MSWPCSHVSSAVTNATAAALSSFTGCLPLFVTPTSCPVAQDGPAVARVKDWNVPGEWRVLRLQ